MHFISWYIGFYLACELDFRQGGWLSKNLIIQIVSTLQKFLLIHYFVCAKFPWQNKIIWPNRECCFLFLYTKTFTQDKLECYNELDIVVTRFPTNAMYSKKNSSNICIILYAFVSSVISSLAHIREYGSCVCTFNVLTKHIRIVLCHYQVT